ncbi:MAG: SDR family oxidoreductase [Pseudomonadota bacterium]|nr:SDR family oxidoreductase [Pseudomonadota bacterium]
MPKQTEKNGQGKPPQEQARQPGVESKMHPRPDWRPRFPGAGRLKNKVALITGGDSGIGRACSALFAREGADIAIVYLKEKADAEETKAFVEQEGRAAVLIDGDIGDPAFCKRAVSETLKAFGAVDVLLNNAAEQHPSDDFEAIPPEQIRRTFETNVFGYFYMTQAALPHLAEGSAIVNTASVTAYRGSRHLIDYSATRGAVVAFTRSLSQYCAPKKIRVNAVAPGPIWTPLIPASFDAEEVAKFGADQPLGRAGEPNEVAACHLFLACEDSSYMTGQVLHPNGGEIVGG